MLERIGPRSLVIVPGDREDVIEAIVGARREGAGRTGRGGTGGAAAGLVLSGGYRPSDRVIDVDPAGRPVRHARARGHLRGRLRGP